MTSQTEGNRRNRWIGFLTVGLFLLLLLTLGWMCQRGISQTSGTAIVRPFDPQSVQKPTTPLAVMAQKLASTVDGDSGKPVCFYNRNGQLQQIVYPDGSAYYCTYNQRGEKIMEQERTGKKWIYLYEQNLMKVVDAQGHVEERKLP